MSLSDWKKGEEEGKNNKSGAGETHSKKLEPSQAGRTRAKGETRRAKEKARQNPQRTPEKAVNPGNLGMTMPNLGPWNTPTPL